MSNNKVYWRGTEELEKDASFVANAEKEFSEELPIDQFLGKKELDSTNTSRRDFLKFMGFGITAATLAACETPVMKSLPYVVKPNEVMPGIANYYASTYFDGHDYASVLVKTREGRPIHIEGNKHSNFTKGGVSARVNSSVLSLYNTNRYQHPMKDGAASDWATVDGEIKAALEGAKASGAGVRVLSSTIISPSSQSLIDKMSAWFNDAAPAAEGEEVETASRGNFSHVTYDAVSFAGVREAHNRTHGQSMIPSYHLDRANVVVSIGSDFLINGINPLGMANDYAKMRNPEADMSRHYQFEATLTTTGSNADVRGAVRPSDYGAVVSMLYSAVGGSGGGASLADDDNGVAAKIAEAAKDLKAARGKSLVLCGSNDPNIQTVVNGINEMLGNYGGTIDTDNPVHLRKGSDADAAALVSDLNSGRVGVIMVVDCNPVDDMPGSWNFAGALANAGVRVAMNEKPNNTSKACNYVCPTGHYLEGWNDANPAGNEVSFSQPAIQAIYDTRQWQESFMKWMGMGGSYYDYLKSRWDTAATPADDPSVVFASRWNKYVHDGIGMMAAAAPAMEEAAAAEEGSGESTGGGFNSSAVAAAAGAISGGGTDWEVEFYEKAGIGIGNYAENPWLQELPDPVTKVVWDQYVTMNPADMAPDAFNLNTKVGEQERSGMVRVTVGDQSVELPVVALPGQKRGTIGVALGYGKASVIETQGVTEVKEERVIGSNAFAMLPVSNGYVQYSAPASIEKIERRYNIASTQTHHTMMGRKILNETNLKNFKDNDREAWNPVVKVADAYGTKQTVDNLDLWNEHSIDIGHRWGMSIDLNSCIGCGACVTACHSENNVPIVGKDEVNRTRTMSWIRIDRYYSSDADPELHGDLNQDKDYEAMEDPSMYPQVGFMPVMCQHCNHAPCETVCPVAATTHSDEGFNQMAYNRCIGTRYCANNCPYKVRRFNWFNYIGDPKFTDVNPASDDLARMVLNPDVVVRSRGVMEKCSLCVQRVQAGKLEAKKNGEPVQDGSIQTACSSACPTHAITFGDINDKDSQARAQAMNDRAYHLLEEVGVQPNIWYQTKVRNANETETPVAEETA